MESLPTIVARLKDSFRAYLSFGTVAASLYVFQEVVSLPLVLTFLVLGGTGVCTLLAMLFLWFIRSDILLLEKTLNEKN
ncbi:MAG: hypothetical protein K2W82_16700 [Candidatus Obscuribacterales bacterium]|nr:hypothetical protein [Candidatus Obscuribacterales bacterium]